VGSDSDKGGKQMRLSRRKRGGEKAPGGGLRSTEGGMVVTDCGGGGRRANGEGRFENLIQSIGKRDRGTRNQQGRPKFVIRGDGSFRLWGEGVTEKEFTGKPRKGSRRYRIKTKKWEGKGGKRH